MITKSFLAEHARLTRRFFLQAGIAGFAAAPVAARLFAAENQPSPPAKPAKSDKAGAQPEPYFTRADDFRDVSRGKPLPHSLSEEKRREVRFAGRTSPRQDSQLPRRAKNIQLVRSEFRTIETNCVLDCGCSRWRWEKHIGGKGTATMNPVQFWHLNAI